MKKKEKETGMLMGEVHLLKRAGQVSYFTGHALLGSLQGRGGGATMLSGSLQAFDGHTPPPVLFLSFFFSSPFCPEVRKRGETGEHGVEDKSAWPTQRRDSVRRRRNAICVCATPSGDGDDVAASALSAATMDRFFCNTWCDEEERRQWTGEERAD